MPLRERGWAQGEQARIEHIAFEVDSTWTRCATCWSRAASPSPGRRFPPASPMMIWTDAATSGGVQYQFLRRPGGEGGSA